MSASESLIGVRFDRGERTILLVAAALVCGLSWFWLIVQAEAHPHGQPALATPTFGFVALALAAGMWLVMMVAMMLPAVTPWILLFDGFGSSQKATQRRRLDTALFVAGYFAVWGAFSLTAALIQLQLPVHAGWAELRLAPAAGAFVLIAAGAYQLSPLKSACLSHCRSPLGFLLARWRDGPVAAFELGSRHGVHCLGCCWALMAVSFAVGVMNLLWMGGLTLLLCLEKLAPRGRRLSRLFGVSLVAWGVWRIALNIG